MYLPVYDFKKDKKVLERFQKKNRKLRVALLCGPRSQEDAVYWSNFPFELTSSGFVHQNLRQLGFETKVVKNTLKHLEKRLQWAAVVFLNVHGEFGEDGAEEYIAGRSLTVSILDLPTQRVVLPIIEFLPRTKDLYDQELKIRSQRGEPVVDYPIMRDLSKELYEHICAAALEIYAESECSGFARIDFVLDIQNQLYVLEVNTIPGLQRDSNFLLCAEAAGITPKTVLLSLLHRALR